MTAPTRAAGYVRVSMVGARGDDIMSPDLQLAAIRAWCDRHGAELVKVVEDIDRSGRTWRPRKIGPLVDEVAAGTLDAIVVWKWSRFARHRVDWAVHVDRVESAGGQLASATEDVDTTTSAGRFARGMLAELAAFESERIGEGWRETHRARHAAGLPPGGRPFGWRKAGRGIEPHPEQAPVVAELYQRYTAGATFWQLTQWLNGQGVRTRRGGTWAPGPLRDLLDNPVHAGRVRLNGVEVPGQHAPIVDEDTAAAYWARRRAAQAAPRREASPFLLTGLVVCSTCDRAMVGGSNGGKWPHYRCQHAVITKAHAGLTVPAHRVESVVLADLAGMAAAVDEAAGRLSAHPVAVPDVERMAGQVAALDRKLAALVLRELDGTPAAALELARADLVAQRAALVSSIQAERDRLAQASTAPRVAAADLLDEWDELPLNGRRAALRALYARVDVQIRPLLVEPIRHV